ncbi:MAG: TRAM domain-containing protein [Planctomycetes bacterium]|nr:TRAM domain-containing protein [Planctomycetota bacterium]
MALWILRAVFLVTVSGVAVSLLRSDVFTSFLDFLAVVVVSLAVIGLDIVVREKRIEIISCVYFGIVVGLILTFVVGAAITPLMPNPPPESFNGVMLIVGVVLCYASISFLLQTRDDFRFVIPYVEFAKEVKGLKPYILDTSVVIDGRIADVVETQVMDNQLIMPRFVLNELQAIADSNDKLRRSRGRRGLDILNRLRSNESVDLHIYDRESPEMADQPVDMKLVLLAKRLEGKIVTGDYNLNKVAKLHNVPVINLNDLANALKPAYLPGETLRVHIVKPGEENGQGVGYLDDGTMVVVEQGRLHMHRDVQVAVTSVLQTSAGRMIFGKCEKVS